MPSPKRTPEQLAEELLGRALCDLAPEEQNVLRHIAAGVLVRPDGGDVLHASFGDRLADRVAAVGGSWGFIIAFMVVLFGWMLVNSRAAEAFGLRPFDSYPYIFLNLVLSMLAAIQAPVIMMSQNRQAAKDRMAAQHDYEVNLRAQLELISLHRRLDRLMERLEVKG
jgi:uncharacterized membrane protein